MRVEITIYEGERRVVALLDLESEPKGYVMAPSTYDKIRPALIQKYGEFNEVEVPASPELIALVKEAQELQQEIYEDLQTN